MTKSKEIKLFEASRKAMIAKLDNFVQFLDSVPENTIDQSIVTKLQFYLKNIDKLNENYEDVCIQLTAAEVSDDQEVNASEFCNKYIDAVSKATLILDQNQPSPSDSLNHTNISSSFADKGANAKLPRISLPSYDGSYIEFTSYYESFVSLIHENQNLSDIEKFMYLKSSLKSTAAQAIANIQPSGENYKIAFDLLCERFNNPKLIILNHIKGIMELNTLNKSNATDLRKLFDNFTKHIRALENHLIPVKHCNSFIYYILMSKLDDKTKSKFTEFKPRAIPTLDEIIEFLKNHCELLEEIDTNAKGSAFSNSNNSGYKHNNKGNFPNPKVSSYKQSLVVTSENISCQHCKGNHFLNQCPSFLALSVKQRFDRVSELKTCKNCLRHSSHAPCNSKYRCRLCHKRHNTLLHLESVVNEINNQTTSANSSMPHQKATNEVSFQVPTSSTALSCFRSLDVLLPTARVNVRSADNKWHPARLILDSGSHSNFITEDFAIKLNLKRQKINVKIMGINACLAQSDSAVRIRLASMTNDFQINMQCLVIPKIAENLPLQSFDKVNLNIPENIKLSDNNFNESLPVDILIGAGNFSSLLCVGQIALGKNKPLLQKTLLGWIVSGMYQSNQRSCNLVQSNLIIENYSDPNEALDKTLQTFWQIEDVQPRNNLSKLSREERFCEEHFQSTVSQNSTGRLIVSIPFNSKLSKLGDSLEQATIRFLYLEKRLIKNQDRYAEYSKFIHEYIKLGHMSKIANDSQEIPETYIVKALDAQINVLHVPAFYLPHHAVFKASSLTTKVRVVFDGSAKSSSGISINDTQIVGPVIQDDLFSIILRFRKHKIALTGDIEKMYRQVLIQHSERKFQRILWRDNPNMPLETYELNTITYGTTSASYLATKCLHYVSEQNSRKMPTVSHIIKSDFYMDDLLTGADTAQEVLQIKNDLVSVLGSVGLPIRKFLSNCPDILLNDSQCDSSFYTIPLGERENAKALGVSWNSLTDVLQYDIHIKQNSASNTKRSILSAIAQLFDPLGLLTPVIVTGKLLIQKLWKLKISWDEGIPESLSTEWNMFKSELPFLSTLKIPRCVITANHVAIDLHGFSDSSCTAYGACVYIVSIDSYNNVSSRLLCSKSRVAPLRALTIPRLELCAALLLAQLVQKVRFAISIDFSKIFLWSDSTIALSWIKSTPNKYKVFVANRIACIQEISNPNDWYYIPSKQNPADLVSRGSTATELINHSLWWCGPSFLSQATDQWPDQLKFKPIATPDSELKTDAASLSFLSTHNSSIFKKYSSFTKLKRVVSWILRFIGNCKLNKESRNYGTLQPSELRNASYILAKLCQLEAFPSEIRLLELKQPLKSTSHILSLNIFLDENKLLRVGGRIKNSNYSFEKKFPILLPKGHLLTSLIFQYFHKHLLHCGPQQLLASVREYYWPISGRNLAKQVVHNCVKCFRASPKSYDPLMADLPAKRLAEGTPVFSHVGLDYAGPILIKDRKLRGAKYVKSYISLFVCMVTKAIHLELVTELTTKAFLAVFKRFIGRRGLPLSVTSDNATYFKGAANELRDLFKFLKSDEGNAKIGNYLTSKGVKWDFIIPKNPQQGGIWESGIKCVKSHLKRVLGNTCLNYEDFSTLLIQIEAVLNSRPLSPLSSDSDDTTPLTPGHFLISRPFYALPETNLMNGNENRLDMYQKIQRRVQDFWRRWSLEVVPELQRRTKWFKQMPTIIKLNSLALIKEDNLPPLQWILGRIVEIHSYSDGIARSVTLQLSNGHKLKRPVNKVCVLPVE